MKKIKEITKKIKFKKILYFGLFLTIITTLFIFYIDNKISSNADGKIYEDVSLIPHKEFALLLGTAKKFMGNPNKFYVARIKATEELYKNHKVDKILISGDKHDDYSEPDDMKKDLVADGIPEDKIILDYKGYSTIKSIRRAENIFKINDYTIVSQKFHCERAIYMAEVKNQKAICFRAEDVNSLIAKKVYIREKLSRLKAWIYLHILKK